MHLYAPSSSKDMIMDPGMYRNWAEISKTRALIFMYSSYRIADVSKRLVRNGIRQVGSPKHRSCRSCTYSHNLIKCLVLLWRSGWRCIESYQSMCRCAVLHQRFTQLHQIFMSLQSVRNMIRDGDFVIPSASDAAERRQSAGAVRFLVKPRSLFSLVFFQLLGEAGCKVT